MSRNFKIAVCDRDPETCLWLQNCIKIYNRDMDVSVFCGLDELMSAYQSTFYDLVFLEPRIVSAVQYQTARELMRHLGKPLIIYVTDSEAFAIRGYGIAFRYLLKPVAFRDVVAVLREALHVVEPHAITIKIKGEQILVPFGEIIYFEIHGREVTLCGQTGEYSFRGSLKQLLLQLPAWRFSMPFRGYIVNLQEVTRLTSSMLTLSSGIQLPVSRGFYKSFSSALKQFEVWNTSSVSYNPNQ